MLQTNNRMEEYDTVIRQLTNALRNLNKRPTTKVDVSCVRDGDSDAHHTLNVTGSEKKSTSVTHAMYGNKKMFGSALNINLLSTRSDKLSVIKDKTLSRAKNSSLSPSH